MYQLHTVGIHHGPEERIAIKRMGNFALVKVELSRLWCYRASLPWRMPAGSGKTTGYPWIGPGDRKIPKAQALELVSGCAQGAFWSILIKQSIGTCSHLFWKGYRILQKKYRASVRSSNEKGSRILRLAGQVTKAARTTSLYELGITWQRPGYCII